MSNNTGHLRICTFNVNGLRAADKRPAIFKKLRDERYDLSFLQETHCTPEVQTIWQAEWGGNIIFSNGVSNSRGVAILFGRGLDYKCVKKLIDVHGRYIVVHIIKEGIDYLLCNIYAPTQGHEIDQLSTLNQIMEAFQEFETENYLVGGDFNEVLDPKIDRKKLRSNSIKNGKVQISDIRIYGTM